MYRQNILVMAVVSGRLDCMAFTNSPHQGHEARPSTRQDKLSGDAVQVLVARATGGDARAFSQLVGQYYDFIFAVSFRLLRHREDAEDLAQAVCIKLASVLGQYKGKAAFTTWLYRVIWNTGQDHLRARKGGATTALSENDIYQSETVGAEKAMCDRAAVQAVYDLPEKYRDAVLLVFAEGLSHAEAANVLGCTEGNVSWRIHEARKRLSVALKGIWP